MERLKTNIANKEYDYYKNLSDGYHDSSPPLFASHLTYTDPSHKDREIKWDYPAQIVGQKISSLNIHLCLECQNPILTYGRLMPCRHVLCFDCVNKLIKHSCTRCKEKVQRIEKIYFNQMHLCIQNVTPKPGQTPDLCFKGYLTLEDLKAHIQFRHQQPASLNKPLLRDLKVNTTLHVSAMSSVSPTSQQNPTLNNTSTHISASAASYQSWKKATLSTIGSELPRPQTKRSVNMQYVHRQNFSNATLQQSSVTTTNSSIPALLSLTFTPPHEYQQQASSSHNYPYNQMPSTLHSTIEEPSGVSKRKRKSPTPTNNSDELNSSNKFHKRASLHASLTLASPSASPKTIHSAVSQRPLPTNNFTLLNKVVEGLPYKAFSNKKVSGTDAMSSANNPSLVSTTEVSGSRKVARVKSCSTLPSPTPSIIKAQDQPKMTNYRRETLPQIKISKTSVTSNSNSSNRPSATLISSSAYIALLEPPPPPPILPTTQCEINLHKTHIPPPPPVDKSNLHQNMATAPSQAPISDLVSSPEQQSDLKNGSNFTSVAMKQLISCLPPPPPPPIINYVGENEVKNQIALEESLVNAGTSYYKDVDPAALLLLNLSAAACGPITLDEKDKEMQSYSVALTNTECIVSIPVIINSPFTVPPLTAIIDNGCNADSAATPLDDDNSKEEILEIVNNDSPQAPYVTTLVREISEKSEQNTPYFPISVVSVTSSSSEIPRGPSHHLATVESVEAVSVAPDIESLRKGDVHFNQQTSTHHQGIMSNGAYPIDKGAPLSLDSQHPAYPPPTFDKYHAAALAYSPFQMYPPYHSPYQAAAYSQYLLSKKAFDYSNNGLAPPLYYQPAGGLAPHNGCNRKTPPDLPFCTVENFGRTAITHNSNVPHFSEGQGYQPLDFRETMGDSSHSISNDEIQSSMDTLVYNPPRFLPSFPPNLPQLHPHHNKYSPYSSLLQQQHHHQGSPFAIPQYLFDKYMASHGAAPPHPLSASPLPTSEPLAYQHHLPPHLYPGFPRAAAYYRFPHMTPPSHVMGLGELPPPSYAEQLNMMALANQPNRHPPP